MTQNPRIKYSRFFGGVILYLLSLEYKPNREQREVLGDLVKDAAGGTPHGQTCLSSR